MHIACLYLHYCNPDCADGARAYTMLKHLGRRHRVTLLTARNGYERRLTRAFPWVPEGVDVHMLDVPYHNRMSAWKRLGAYLGFPLWAFYRGLRISRPDLVYGISTPLTTGWAAERLARWLGVPWVLEVRDLWPDFPVQMGAVPFAPLRRGLYALERRLYRRADHVVTVSPDMTAHVRRHGVPARRATTLLQGTDFDLLDAATDEDVRALRRRHGLDGQRVVLYAGTFGRANALPTLLGAARRLAGRADVTFVFAGHGYYAPRLRRAARRRANVKLLPPQPRHRMFPWFRLAALALVSFIDRPVLATNAPSKFFDSLAAGTPVVVTNPGWTRAFVEKHRCGWYAPPEDADALAERIEEVLDHPEQRAEAGRRGATVARRQFDRRALARQLEAIFQRTAGAAS